MNRKQVRDNRSAFVAQIRLLPLVLLPVNKKEGGGRCKEAAYALSLKAKFQLTIIIPLL